MKRIEIEEYLHAGSTEIHDIFVFYMGEYDDPKTKEMIDNPMQTVKGWTRELLNVVETKEEITPKILDGFLASKLKDTKRMFKPYSANPSIWTMIYNMFR